MSTKADYNAQEWETVVNGPAVAGLIVVAAEAGGTIRESLEMGRAYKDAQQAHLGPPLIGELLGSPPEINPGDYSGAGELRTKGLEDLRAALAVLEGTADEDEIDSYRGFVMGIAERVAHKHKTGGFLGFGGREVSENEQLALDEIREAIGAHAIPDSEEE